MRVVREAQTDGRVRFRVNGMKVTVSIAGSSELLIEAGVANSETRRRLRNLYENAVGAQPSDEALRVMSDAVYSAAEEAQKEALVSAATQAAHDPAAPTDVQAEVEFVRGTGGSTQAGGPGAEGLAGQGLVFSDPEPWPDPVDGAVLLDEMSKVVTKYLVLPTTHALVAVVLWILHTWTWEQAAEFSPRLIVTGPKKRCGKSRLFEVITPLVRRALLTASLTLAAMFRILDEHHPSILIDEFDALSDDLREALRGVLNSGQRRGGVVHRCAGDDHEVRAFAVFGPVAVAGIGKMPDTVEDRGIRVGMRRKTKQEKVGRLRKRRFDAEVAETTRRICRWAKDHEKALAGREPSLPEALDDRAADGWEALLAIADEVGGDWPKRARDAAIALSAGREEADDAADTLLLGDIRAIFRDIGDRIASKRMAEILGAKRDRPWIAWGKSQKPISESGIARLLKPFEIAPRTIRVGEGGSETQKGYLKEWFEDAFERYLPPEVASAAVTPSHEPVDPSTGANAKESTNVTERNVTDADSFDFKPARGVQTHCDGVTAGNGPKGEGPDEFVCKWCGQVGSDAHDCPGGPS